MAIPTSYFVSATRVPKIFEAIRGAKAPEQFTQRFLVDLGFGSSADRPMVRVLKDLDFLESSGAPTDRYFKYLDDTIAGSVLAEAIRDAYADLFAVNRDAHEMEQSDIKAKLATLSKGQYTDKVLGLMAKTFVTLVGLADFSSRSSVMEESPGVDQEAQVEERAVSAALVSGGRPARGVRVDGLVYNINIHLPESRDPQVYDALFQSMNRHLGGS